MFEYFTSNSCNELVKSTNCIDAGILYNDEDNQLYHYLFKNIQTNTAKYVICTKCRIQEDKYNW